MEATQRLAVHGDPVTEDTRQSQVSAGVSENGKRPMQPGWMEKARGLFI